MFSSLIDKVNSKFNQLEIVTKTDPILRLEGKIISILGNIITATIKGAELGAIYRIQVKPYSSTQKLLFAEVVAIDGLKVKLLPYGSIEGLSQQASIVVYSAKFQVKVGNLVLGKVLNGIGEIIGVLDKSDANKPTTESTEPNIFYDINAPAPPALTRPVISEKIITGVKAIDMFITCGKGQRLGIFAGPGSGKTTLLGMILRNIQADVVVIALVGERGREVNEFIELEFGQKNIASKCVLVVATSDQPPIEQIKSPFVAQTIAEYFRSQGKDVLLLVDSVTRLARAQREVGLAAGEPLARGGYPSSSFQVMPKLMERAGTDSSGSITALYTVLMEGVKISDDPIADEVKSIVDGHIVLNPKLATMGHYPAIDVTQSLSRIADRLITPEQLSHAQHLRMLIAKYDELEFLIKIGEYKPGNDAISDEAVNKHERIIKFLQQPRNLAANFETTLRELCSI